jgi:hypothetical protein
MQKIEGFKVLPNDEMKVVISEEHLAVHACISGPS